MDGWWKRRLDERRQRSVERTGGHRNTAEAWFSGQNPSFVLFKGEREVGGLEEQQAAAALHSTNFPLLISDISG